MTSPAIRFAGLTIRAGGARILGPLDLEVVAGEHMLLVGPSGSGKTTALRAIAGLATPSQGSVELLGATASTAGRLRVPPERRGLGYLFQGGGLWPHMSARRTLEFVLRHAGVPRRGRAARVGELLDQVQLPGFEERMPGTLSGGEAQRLALARAMASQPRIMLLDEPLGPLDAELRDSLLTRLAELHSELGWTTVHVTHDPAEASRAADRVVRLRDGLLDEDAA